MRILRTLVSIVATAGFLAFAQSAMAQPMLCSGEMKACIAACNKSPNRGAAPVCITNCRTRGAMCTRTGCWDTGTRKYCGMTRR